MKRLLLLVLLVACAPKMCPQGFVSAQVNESAACISSMSYCVSDKQCSSAQYDCSRPCAHLAVNVLFSARAQEQSQLCDRSAVRCRQVPYVDARCVSNQCVAVPHYADELIPVPAFLEVAPNKSVCFEKRGIDSIVRLNVLNNATIPLQQLEAYVNVSLRNGSVFLAKVDLLDAALLPNESAQIRRLVKNATPLEIHIFAVRPVQGKGVSFGVKNSDTAASAKIVQCDAKDS